MWLLRITQRGICARGVIVLATCRRAASLSFSTGPRALLRASTPSRLSSFANMLLGASSLTICNGTAVLATTMCHGSAPQLCGSGRAASSGTDAFHRAAKAAPLGIVAFACASRKADPTRCPQHRRHRLGLPRRPRPRRCRRPRRCAKAGVGRGRSSRTWCTSPGWAVPRFSGSSCSPC